MSLALSFGYMLNEYPMQSLYNKYYQYHIFPELLSDYLFSMTL